MGKRELGLWAGLGVFIGVSLILVLATDGDLGTWVLTVGVLLVAGVTLESVWASPGRLVISAFEDSGHSDLIFYVDDGLAEGVPPVPRDYLLQLHVGVANTGRRKATLTDLRLLGFETEGGSLILLPEGVQGPLHAHMWRQQRGSPPPGQAHVLAMVETIPPPVTLEPDEVVRLRFRMRRGIDWSDRWTVEQLREFAEALSDRIVAVQGEVAYRSGASSSVEPWRLDIVVEQQQLYTDVLRDLTDGFTKRPHVEQRDLPVE